MCKRNILIAIKKADWYIERKQPEKKQIDLKKIIRVLKTQECDPKKVIRQEIRDK
jgi:hypothetical protein